MVPKLPILGLLMASPLLLATAACVGPPESGKGGPSKMPERTTLTCPALSGDLSGLLGVDPAIAARVARVVRLTDEIKATVDALDRETRGACTTLARDLSAQPVSAAAHPCQVAEERFVAFVKSLPQGASFELSVRGVQCGAPKGLLEQCAGECLTGTSGVTSALACGATSGASCSGALSFPNASGACATQCATRALRLSTCAADVDIALSPGAEHLAPVVAALRRDLPKIVGLGVDLAPRAAGLAKDTLTLVDELASSIDALSVGSAPTERRVVSAAALATCAAPQLAEVVRAGASLETSMERTVSLHRVLTKR